MDDRWAAGFAWRPRCSTITFGARIACKNPSFYNPQHLPWFCRPERRSVRTRFFPPSAPAAWVVWKARGTSLNRLVAIKASLSPFDERFESE